MKFVKSHPFLLLFIVGLVLRLTVLFLDFSFDVNNHIVWASDLAKHGPQGFYYTISSSVFAALYPNYPPIAIGFFYIFFLIQQLIFHVSWWLNLHISAFPSNMMFVIQERYFLAGILKLPAVGFDFGIAWLMILFAKKIVPKCKSAPILGAALVLLNPVFIYNSAYWGQIDAIPLFFTLASFYGLMYSERFFFSSIIFTIGLLVKPTPLIFLPMYVAYFIYKFGIKNLITSSILSTLLFWIVFIPFLQNSFSIFELYTIYSDKILAAQSLPYVTNGAFNFWLILTQFKGIKDTELFLFNIPYKIWGYGITFIFMAFGIYLFLKSKKKELAFLFSSFLSGFAAILFLTKMHERYFILLLPFLLVISLKEKRFMKWFYVLTFLSFLNMYHSWAVPRIDLVAHFIDNPITYTTICVANCLLFFFLLKSYQKLNKKIREG